MKIRKLAGLRFVMPKDRKPDLDKDEVEARARDAGFSTEAEHEQWRRKNEITAPTERK